MAMFKVGQRVRIVCVIGNTHPASLVGQEGVVNEIDEEDSPTFYGLDIAPLWEDDEFVYGFEAAELSPIIPEGMQPVAWENCLWQPNGVHA